MAPHPSKSPMGRPILPRVQDRISFLYAERCVVNRDNNAVTFADERGITHVPAAGIAALLLGPGTKVTYAAMALLGDSGFLSYGLEKRVCATTHPAVRYRILRQRRRRRRQ